MVGWHHLLNGHGFGWTPGVGDGQGGLACCGLWGCKESDMTERLKFQKGMTEINQWDLSNLINKGNHKQKEKTTLRIGENICIQRN